MQEDIVERAEYWLRFKSLQKSLPNLYLIISELVKCVKQLRAAVGSLQAERKIAQHVPAERLENGEAIA